MKGPFFKNLWRCGIAVLEDNIFITADQRWNSAIQHFSHESPDINCQTRGIVYERRRYPRFAISLPVSHKIQGKWWGRWKKAQTVDVSQNGVRLALDTPVPVGTRLVLSLKLPHYRKRVKLKGVVVWQKPSLNSDRLVESGIAFEDLRKSTAKDKFVTFMADRLCAYVLKNKDSLKVRTAQSQEDLLQAYGLIYQEYRLRGYCAEHPSKLHYNFYCMTAESATFVLANCKKVVGTISLFVDSDCGLPIDSIFADQLALYRRPSRKLAEVGLLAVDHSVFGRKSFSLTDRSKLAACLYLFKIMFDYAQSIGVTDLFIALHPRHRDLYTYLTFEAIKAVPSYPGACGQPAILMHMEIARTYAVAPPHLSISRYFLCEKLAPELYTNRLAWTPDLVREFLKVKKDLWSTMTSSERDYFRSLYPGVDTGDGGDIQTEKAGEESDRSAA